MGRSISAIGGVMDQHIYAITLWVLGMAFILCVFESEDTASGNRLLFLAVVWPFYTLYLVFHEIMDTFRE